MSSIRPIMTESQRAMNAIGLHVRKNFKHRTLKYNYPSLVKLAFNDAMTYNPETGKGGTVMGIRFREQKLKKHNKEHLGVLENLIYMKDHMTDIKFDKFSYSDYLQAHAIVAIKEALGPDLTEYHKIGRVDAQSPEELKGASEVPNPEDGASKFRDLFYEKNFQDKDIVALSFIYMFGVFRTHYERTYTEFSIFENEYYKHIVNGENSSNPALDKILVGDDALKEYVQLFAEDKKEWFDAFSDAYLKLFTLGNDDKPLFLEIPDKYEY